MAQILRCFPKYGDEVGNSSRLRIVDVPGKNSEAGIAPRVLAFSVDTAVEEHGPHLPLGTDTIQSYSVLQELADTVDGFEVGRPLEYGQLTWGLPFGFSVDRSDAAVSDFFLSAWKEQSASSWPCRSCCRYR